jgi:hypothetical protein
MGLMNYYLWEKIFGILASKRRDDLRWIANRKIHINRDSKLSTSFARVHMMQRIQINCCNAAYSYLIMSMCLNIISN